MSRLAPLAAYLVAAALAAASLAAGPAPSRPQSGAKGPLAGLPSPPGPHVPKIEAMADDSWLVLSSPAPDPEWGTARGRAWTPRMPYAPDLRAALLCGCGRHGFVKPDGHYMDDLWAYDVNAHRWVCVYPGANTRDLKLTLDAHGFEVNAAGEYVPVSYLSHGYCNQTYVAHLRRLMLIYTQCPWWSRALPQRWTWLDQQYEDVRTRTYGHAGPIIENPKHPLFYDVAEGRWERTWIEGDGPGDRRFEGVLEYVPSRRRAFYLYRGRVWFYDFDTEKWIAGDAEPVDVAYDSNGCFDTRRERVYVAQREKFLAYDVGEDVWQRIRAPGQPDDLGNSASGTLTYDSAGDVVLWHQKEGRGIRIYDPKRNAWSDVSAPPQGPEVEWKYRQMHGFYDPELCVHFYFLAGDSAENGLMLVYRYRRGPRSAARPGTVVRPFAATQQNADFRSELR